MNGQPSTPITFEALPRAKRVQDTPPEREYKILAVHLTSATRAALDLAASTETYRLSQAATATEVFAAISSESIDLVIVDCAMPELSAIELCRIIKKAAGTRFIPVFVVGAQYYEMTEVQAIQAGADAYLVEPIRPVPLRARIQAILRHKSMIESLDDPEMVLFSLAQSVEDRDPALQQHCERLAHICSALGLAMGLSPQQVVTLQRAAYLHDIGKVAIPDSILLKPSALSAEEWTIMQSHAERGERICRNIRSLAEVLPVIRHHHEKWDGSGYPDRLEGEEIPLLARILQTADIYDALTTERPYKQALTPEQALAIMQAEADKGWRDPVLTKRFAEILPTLAETQVPDLSQLSLRALAHSLSLTQVEAAA